MCVCVCVYIYHKLELVAATKFDVYSGKVRDLLNFDHGEHEWIIKEEEKLQLEEEKGRKRREEMYSQTRRQVAVTAALFAAGVSFMGVGAHLAYSNVEAEQARLKARRDFVKDRLRKLIDDDDD
ncbi:uncharacterized protein LOC133829743 isoform X1 [Humulus lupulus]|uniref:uncharacterized protein LOC133829743 isoform X1 n=2 Tax=Humulus lupulus TaxID=3486 RepID=UPI002B404C94|nr:uncharacterized protein LOC133829743 isoform X1 [Humulus lupulus]